MRVTDQRFKLAGIALVAMLTIATALVANANTPLSKNAGDGQRRGRDWDGYPNLGGSFDLRQTALNAGYNEGSKEGRNDRSKNRYRDYNDFKSYRNADSDYSSRLGDRSLYQRYYRMAFESGYDTENPPPNRRNNNRDYDRDRDGHRGRNWDRYGTYGGSFQLRQTALNAGYNEGIKEGRKDRNRRPGNFRNNSAYRNATKDYSSRLGNRALYQRYYREGYENGYADGYNGY